MPLGASAVGTTTPAALFTSPAVMFWNIFLLCAIVLGIVAFIGFAVWFHHWTDVRFAVTQYEKSPSVLTDGEKAFYPVLVEAVTDRNVVFPKVRLADVVHLRAKPRSNSSYWEAFNRISQRHVDFVIADAKSLQTVLIVELDDKTHLNPKQAKKDAFLNSILQGAGIPIARVKASRSYNAPDLAVELRLAWQSVRTDKNALTKVAS